MNPGHPRPNPKGNPLVEHVKDQYITGQTSRRQFLRQATLLGVSLTAASGFLAACSPVQDDDAQDATGNDNAQGATGNGAEPQAATPSGQPVRGGTYTVAMGVLELEHPHRLASNQPANVMRQVNEYLTYQNRDGISEPYLLESYEPNDNADIWTLKLRQGIEFSNGDELTTNDVMWNFESWLSEDVGSSMFGLLSAYLTLDGVEQVDDYTIRLNLERPHIGVAENLYHYAAMILRQGFEPPNLEAGQSMVELSLGTGPFTLEEYSTRERARVVRRDNYWRIAPDGDPFPYLDEVIWTDLGDERSTAFAALESGQIDSIYQPGPGGIEQFEGNADIRVVTIPTNDCSIIRMRTDQEPFTDPLVRNAFKKLCDRRLIQNTAFFGTGQLAADAHIGPAAPDFVEKPIPEVDIGGAMELLEQSEAWQAWGNQPIEMVAKSDTRWEQVIAETFQATAAEAGVNIELDIRPPDSYWPAWNHYTFSVSDWGHRPLNTMLIALAYTEAAVPPDEDSGLWNETRWVNEEFEEEFGRATSEPDLEARLTHIDRMMDIMIEDSGTIVPTWKDTFEYQTMRIQNNVGHPVDYLQITETWIDEEA